MKTAQVCERISSVISVDFPKHPEPQEERGFCTSGWWERLCCKSDSGNLPLLDAWAQLMLLAQKCGSKKSTLIWAHSFNVLRQKTLWLGFGFMSSYCCKICPVSIIKFHSPSFFQNKALRCGRHILADRASITTAAAECSNWGFPALSQHWAALQSRDNAASALRISKGNAASLLTKIIFIIFRWLLIGQSRGGCWVGSSPNCA